MAILKIARMGHPILLEVAIPVTDPTGSEIASLVDDMIETLQDSGGIGLAAPQVHVSMRVVIFFQKVNLVALQPELVMLLGAVITPLIELFQIVFGHPETMEESFYEIRLLHVHGSMF